MGQGSGVPRIGSRYRGTDGDRADYRINDGGPEVMTTRRAWGSTRRMIESRIATGRGPCFAHRSQASHVKSPWSRTSYASRRFSITPVVGADVVTLRASSAASLSSHVGVVAGALIVTLGCVRRPVALSCPPIRLSTSTIAAARPPATTRIARSRRLPSTIPSLERP